MGGICRADISGNTYSPSFTAHRVSALPDMNETHCEFGAVKVEVRAPAVQSYPSASASKTPLFIMYRMRDSSILRHLWLKRGGHKIQVIAPMIYPSNGKESCLPQGYDEDLDTRKGKNRASRKVSPSSLTSVNSQERFRKTSDGRSSEKRRFRVKIKIIERCFDTGLSQIRVVSDLTAYREKAPGWS